MTRFLKAVVCVAALLGLMMPTSSAQARGLALIRDAEIERTLRQMSAPVFQAAGLAPESVELYIIRSRSLNAFVAGGRRMFLNTGLMIELERPEELLGVIAHEAGHIAGGHQARRSIQLRNAQGPALIGLLIGVAAGVAGGSEAGVAASAGSQEAIRRLLLKYNRTEEASADQAALGYLERARIDPSGLLAVLERFRGQEVLSIGNVDPYVVSHPLGAERMSLLQRRIGAMSGRTWPEDPAREYWHARLRAKLEGFLHPDRVLDRVNEGPETEFTLYARAIALHQDNDFRTALSEIDRLMAKRPGDAFYTELKGQILFEIGRAAEAVPLYREAARLAPQEPLIKAGLGRALLQLGTARADAEALRVLQDARRGDLADHTALRDLATAYDRAGDRGMATLATAERYALLGDVKNAVNLARRASGILPQGSPGWLRAQDILKLDQPDE